MIKIVFILSLFLQGCITSVIEKDKKVNIAAIELGCEKEEIVIWYFDNGETGYACNSYMVSP